MAASKMRISHDRRRRRGAALLILLAVIGVGAATLLIGAFGRGGADAARERATLLALARAKEALIGFAVGNGRLPRPAASATDGAENPAACASEAACTGWLPWVTLGLAPGDSWGTLLRYSVTPAFTEAPVQPTRAVASKTVRTRDGDGRLRYLAGHADCGLATQCLPLVVFSNGKNNFGAGWQGGARANAASGNLDEQANEAADRHFISRAIGADPARPGGEFDDLVGWVPLALLYQRMSAAGSLP